MNGYTFYSVEAKQLNSTVVAIAYWGYLGRTTENAYGDIDTRYQQGVCVTLTNNHSYFYPAERLDYDDLLAAPSAGAHYNTWFKGRAGGEYVELVKDAPDQLVGVAASVAPFEPVAVTVPVQSHEGVDPNDYPLPTQPVWPPTTTGTSTTSNTLATTGSRRVVLSVRDLIELRDVLEVLEDAGMNELVQHIEYA